MAITWPNTTKFQDILLEYDETECRICGTRLQYHSTRTRTFYQLTGPTRLSRQRVWCNNSSCARYHSLLRSSKEELISWPGWCMGWDVLLWIGFRRFARHWSLPQIRAELRDSYQIVLSLPTLKAYVERYQVMVAARHQDLTHLRSAYHDIADLILSIDGIQPEKGHETVYVVREVRAQRVWFAETLLSSATAEIQRLIHRAREVSEHLALPVSGWITDKQEAFITAIAAEFPGVPHRWCSNHFLRDAAQVLLEVDSHAKVQMRHKVRGLRSLERTVLEGDTLATEHTGLTSSQQAFAGQIVLSYCAMVRGILNDNHGGPLRPAGWRMVEGLLQVNRSLERTLARPSTSITPLLERLHQYIQRGVSRYAEDFRRIAAGIGTLHLVWTLLHPRTGTRPGNQDLFHQVAEQAESNADQLIQHIGHVMLSFEAGLFCGDDTLEIPEDNLDLERWIKGPKSHARHIHGRQHVGLHLVIEAPTFLPAFDAHLSRTSPFTVQELLPYVTAKIPASQQQALTRHQLMRKARSKKNDPTCWKLLNETMSRCFGGVPQRQQQIHRMQSTVSFTYCY
jgi:hypothetical protein